jgi:hypothetical protein
VNPHNKPIDSDRDKRWRASPAGHQRRVGFAVTSTSEVTNSITSAIPMFNSFLALYIKLKGGQSLIYIGREGEGFGYEFAKEVANTISRILRYPEAWTKLSKRTRRQISRQKKKSKSNIMGYGLAFYSPAVVE